MSLAPSDERYDLLMSYRYYRLKRRRNTIHCKSNTKLIPLRKNLSEVFPEKDYFRDNDPILVFDFLTRFVEECDANGLTEAQAFLQLPLFITCTARDPFRAIRASRATGGVTSLSEGVQYILRTYASQDAIMAEPTAFHNLRQG